MNKLNNFFNSWKGSNYFLTLVIGLSVVASTAAASGGLKNFSFLNTSAANNTKLDAIQAAASQGTSDNNTQPSQDLAAAAPEPQSTEAIYANSNTQNNSIRGNSISTQTLDQTAVDLTSDSTTPDALAVEATSSAPDAAATATTTNQNTVVLTSFNPQTLAQHKSTGDCYVAYEGRVYDVSNQSVWNNCTYGVVGGADVTAAFPNAENYFSSLPLIGTYYDPNAAATALANNTNNATTNTNNTSTSTTVSSNNTSNTAATSSTVKTTPVISDDGGSQKHSRSTNSGTTGSVGSHTSGSRHNDD